MPCRGGTITLATHQDVDSATISIRDTGVGMTPEERERCLEPFFTTKGESGTGLGLAVVYGIVQRHKGIIEITSEKNVGTTFSIRFPATTEAAEAIKPQIERLDRTLRVLVVDDQEIICELIAEYLHSDGHTTACAFRGDDALNHFQTGAFDLVITDQAMPAMNGTQLAGAIKKHSPETPVILLTGFGDEMLAVGGQPTGVTSCSPSAQPRRPAAGDLPRLHRRQGPGERGLSILAKARKQPPILPPWTTPACQTIHPSLSRRARRPMPVPALHRGRRFRRSRYRARLAGV